MKAFYKVIATSKAKSLAEYLALKAQLTGTTAVDLAGHTAVDGRIKMI